MRHSFKGASALAALCAGALAFSALPAQADVPGASGNPDADIARVAGIDRTQTALEATTASAVIDKFFIVGYGSQVDALSLAPWNCGTTGYVLYERGNAVEARNLKVLKENSDAEIYVIGGKGVVSEGIEKQLRALNAKGEVGKTVRVGGKDRYDTAYQVGAWVLEDCHVYGTAVADAKDKVDNANAAIDAYDEALANYRKAVAKEDAARAKLEAAQAAVEAAGDKVVEITSNHIDTTQMEKDLEAAKKKADKVKKDAQERIDNLSVITDDIANTILNLPEQSVNTVTVQDFIDAANADPKYKEIADKLAIVVGDSDYGINAGDLLNDAIVTAKEKTDKLEKQKQKAADAVSDYYLKLYEKIEAENNNAYWMPQIAQAKKAFDEAVKAEAKAKAEFQKARAELTQAINALSKATRPYLRALRNLPQLNKAYDNALAAVYKKSVRPIFVSTGVNFADTLAAGPAAAKQDGIVLLTKDEQVPPLTLKALDLSKAQTVAIGGPAARAMVALYPQSAVTISGKDRYATAVNVAKRYFADGVVDKDNRNLLYALASGEVAADAVVAGPYLTSQENFGGVLLTRQGSLPKVTADFLAYGTTGANQTSPYIGAVAVFGGKGAISTSVFNDAAEATHMR